MRSEALRADEPQPRLQVLGYAAAVRAATDGTLRKGELRVGIPGNAAVVCAWTGDEWLELAANPTDAPLDPMPAPDLLTATEHRVIGLLAEAMSLYSTGVVGPERTRAGDVAEFVAKTHDLQNAVLAQAAARAYPTLYRLAGRTHDDGPGL